YQQFLKEFGDTTNPFPTDKYVDKKVLIGGGADSERTVVDALLGLAPAKRLQVAQLGRVKSIQVVGGSTAIRDDFIKEASSRYASQEAFLPISEDDINALIQFLKHGRVLRIAQPGSVDHENDEQALNSPIQIYIRTQEREEKMIEADHAIFTTGF